MQSESSDAGMAIQRQDPIHESSAVDHRRGRDKENGKNKRVPAKEKHNRALSGALPETIELYDEKERKQGMGGGTGRTIDVQA